MNLVPLLKFVYTACAVYLTSFTAAQGYLFLRYLIAWARGNHRSPDVPAPDTWPLVAVQLPIYNEKPVVGHLLEAAAALDYPRDRLIIQVLDDSTDDTVDRIAALTRRYRQLGVDMRHIRRPDRAGYKAGAMAYGLTLVPDAEYVAIFDADFVPPRDFLKRTVPQLLAEPRACFVQTRWGHFNAPENWLTGAQALSFDAYYLMEQTARSRAGLLLTFNGTGGVWRTEAIRDAGGWLSDTLTEDFDLSYRAQIKGWRALFMPEVIIPGEIPMHAEAYKRQQIRWATGSNQTLFKLIHPIWKSPLSIQQKLMATFHLMQYLPAPVMLFMLALSPFMLTTGAFKGLPVAPLAMFTLIPPAMHLVTQMMLGGDWRRRLMNFPFVLVLGTGMMWNNSRAAYRAIHSRFDRRELEFVRTPKFARRSGVGNTAPKAAMPTSVHALVEVALAVFAAIVTLMASRMFPSVVPLFALYAVSLAIVGGRAIYESYERTQQKTGVSRAEMATGKTAAPDPKYRNLKAEHQQRY